MNKIKKALVQEREQANERIARIDAALAYMEKHPDVEPFLLALLQDAPQIIHMLIGGMF